MIFCSTALRVHLNRSSRSRNRNKAVTTREVGWEFVARMLDNGLLEQFQSKPRLLHARGCEVTVRTAARVVERPLGIYPRQPTFVALFLRLFTSSRGEKGAVLVTLKTDEFLCTSPRRNVCILLWDFRLKLVPTEGWKAQRW